MPNLVQIEITGLHKVFGPPKVVSVLRHRLGADLVADALQASVGSMRGIAWRRLLGQGRVEPAEALKHSAVVSSPSPFSAASRPYAQMASAKNTTA